MVGTIKPRDATDLRLAVEWALNEGATLDVRGQGSKIQIGTPMNCDQVLDLSGLSGVVDYAPEELVVGPLRVRPGSRVALLNDEPLTLTPVEFDLLLSLTRAQGRVKSREQLLDEIRNRNYEVFDRSIDVHVSSLRKKLGDDPKTPRWIETVRGIGYRLWPWD